MTQFIPNETYSLYTDEAGNIYYTTRGVNRLIDKNGMSTGFQRLKPIQHVKFVTVPVQTITGMQKAKLYALPDVLEILQYYAFKGNTTAQASLNKLYGNKEAPNQGIIRPPNKKSTYGECYLIWYKDLQIYKIGYGKSAQKRYKDLQQAYPKLLILIGTCYCSNPRKLEQKLHKRYKLKRERGEFFNLDDNDVREILEIFEKSNRPKAG